jgi:diguanylate cyclase (GGDEF)-like protein
MVSEILVVDDTPANLQLLSNVLTERGYKVRMAPSGNLALMNIRTDKPDLILADIKMPGMSGFELCKELKADPDTSDIPVIFISALDQTADKVEAFALGGVDYVTKPFQNEEVLARVATHLTIHSLRKRLMTANAELQKLATVDPLTSLYNRRQFFDLARSEFTRASRYEHNLSLMLIDLDKFKVINDTFGHSCGDRILRRVATCMKENTREVDIPGRLGGDEFVVLVPESTPSHAQILAERLCQKIPEHLKKAEGLDQAVTLSIGIAHYSGETDVILDTLLERADAAMYQAKRAGRNRAIVWSE